MPQRPKRPCAAAGCPGRASNGRYCEAHASRLKADRKPDTRPSPSQRGYDQKWRRIRAQFLKAHPFCADCNEPANEVDHIIPIAKGGSNQWDNLQPMCKSCHSRKTARSDGAFGNAGEGG